jgi:hypothetical protein
LPPFFLLAESIFLFNLNSSKYGLSIVMHLLKVLGEIALGHDIGCKFGKLVKAHPALKDIACEKGFWVPSTATATTACAGSTTS